MLFSIHFSLLTKQTKLKYKHFYCGLRRLIRHGLHVIRKTSWSHSGCSAPPHLLTAGDPTLYCTPGSICHGFKMGANQTDVPTARGSLEAAVRGARAQQTTGAAHAHPKNSDSVPSPPSLPCKSLTPKLFYVLESD